MGIDKYRDGPWLWPATRLWHLGATSLVPANGLSVWGQIACGGLVRALITGECCRSRAAEPVSRPPGRLSFGTAIRYMCGDTWAGSGAAGMESTSATLLQRVKDPRDEEAWREFFRLYFPILQEYARRCGLRPAEAEEVAQECMKTLAGRMRGFCYSRDRGRFKNFLRAMVNNQVANQRRRRSARQAHTGELENLPSPEASRRTWDQVWLREHLAYSIERLESRCSSHTVKAFRLYAL